MTRHLLALIALRAAGAAACDMCSVHCDGCKMLESTCSGLSQRVEDRWREWQVFGSLCENDVCCASDEEDCCEPNVGAIVGLVIALVVVVGGSIYAYRKYKGGKGKEPDDEARHGESSEPDVALQRAAEPETEPEAEAEEMGIMGKLAWYLFGEEEPAVGSDARCVTASDFSYLTEIRAQFERGDKRRDLYIDGEEFGASAMVQSVRKEGPSGLKSKWCRQITPLTPPQNDRYEELQGTVLITGGAGGLGRLLTDYLLHYYPNCSVAIASRSAKETDDPRRKCYACDVCDEEDVRKVCDSIDDLVGVIHCAGVTYGGPFVATNETDSKLLMDIKYWGTRYLYAATKDRKLRFFWLASSISAAVSDFNLTHYACANSSMDFFAEECRAKGDMNVISTQWGALATEGGMALESTRKLMDQRGHGVVSPEQMVDLLEIVIHQASDLPPVVLCSPLNLDKCTTGKPELADSMSWWVGDRFDVYVDALKAKELDRLSKPWTWPDIEELEKKYGCIEGYTTAKQNAAAGLCNW